MSKKSEKVALLEKFFEDSGMKGQEVVELVGACWIGYMMGCPSDCENEFCINFMTMKRMMKQLLRWRYREDDKETDKIIEEQKDNFP